MTPQSDLPLVDVNCPLCGSRESRVLRLASYPRNISVRDLQSLYSASVDSGVFMDQVVECKLCGMVYIDPCPDTTLIQDGYIASNDPSFVAQNHQRIHTFARVLHSILARTGLSPHGRRVLDVGSAGGAFLVAARESGFRVTGIEPSHWLAEYGRTQYGLDVQQGLLESQLFPDSSFDVISFWDVIEHIPEPQGVLSIVHSLLKPDGFLWISYPDVGSIAARLLGWRWPFWHSVHLNYWRRDTMRRQLDKAGYDVLYMQPYWPRLQLGYVLRRAGAVVPPARLLEKLVCTMGLDALPFTYNMGQTVVIAQRKGTVVESCKAGQTRR